jgi:hypothetical protein
VTRVESSQGLCEFAILDFKMTGDFSINTLVRVSVCGKASMKPIYLTCHPITRVKVRRRQIVVHGRLQFVGHVLTICDDAKWILLPLEAPKGHDYFFRVAHLMHVVSKVYLSVVLFHTVCHFLFHSFDKLVPIILFHGVHKIHRIFVGKLVWQHRQGGEIR